jgi:integral membrane protein
MIGIAEGCSFLILVLVAMPLKYFFHYSQPVLMFGWVHGALFISYLIFALLVKISFKKPFVFLIKAFFASILPCGTFIFDRQLKKEDAIA